MLSCKGTTGAKRPTSRRNATTPAMSILRVLLTLFALGLPLMAQQEAGGEANLKLPDLNSASFLGGISGGNLLMGGLVVSALGLVFGLIIFTRLRKMPVHSSMLEVSELIYETCKTYLATQGKFLIILECFIAVIIVFYFGFLKSFEALQSRDHPGLQCGRHLRQFLRRGLRHAREHVRQLAHGLRGAYRQSVPLL